MAAHIHRFDDIALADVEAGTDLCGFWQRIYADGRLAAGMGWQDQAVRVFRQFDVVEGQLQQVTVVAGIANQHRAE
ncbi:hypothetical protein D3C80_1626080 [compost metagenome]